MKQENNVFNKINLSMNFLVVFLIFIIIHVQLSDNKFAVHKKLGIYAKCWFNSLHQYTIGTCGLYDPK